MARLYAPPPAHSVVTGLRHQDFAPQTAYSAWLTDIGPPADQNRCGSPAGCLAKYSAQTPDWGDGAGPEPRPVTIRGF